MATDKAYRWVGMCALLTENRTGKNGVEVKLMAKVNFNLCSIKKEKINNNIKIESSKNGGKETREQSP